jgi:hypothetical protein
MPVILIFLCRQSINANDAKYIERVTWMTLNSFVILNDRVFCPPPPPHPPTKTARVFFFGIFFRSLGEHLPPWLRLRQIGTWCDQWATSFSVFSSEFLCYAPYQKALSVTTFSLSQSYQQGPAGTAETHLPWWYDDAVDSHQVLL